MMATLEEMEFKLMVDEGYINIEFGTLADGWHAYLQQGSEEAAYVKVAISIGISFL